MKPPKFLKLIINVSYFLLALDLILSTLCYIYFLFGGGVKLESLEYITTVQNEESSIAAIVLFTLEIIYSIILFYTVFIIRKLIKDFEKEKLYTKIQITGLNLAGKLLVGVFILQFIADFFTSIILDNRLKISLSFENDLGSPWLLIAIGLFLIYLSKIFNNSARLQLENELTV